MSRKVHYIVVTHMFEKQGDEYFALCKELGTSSSGRTIEEAEQNLIEATSLYLSSAEELGIVDRVLKERKIKVYLHEPEKKEVKLSVKLNSFARPFVHKVPEPVCA